MKFLPGLWPVCFQLLCLTPHTFNQHSVLFPPVRPAGLALPPDTWPCQALLPQFHPLLWSPSCSPPQLPAYTLCHSTLDIFVSTGPPDITVFSVRRSQVVLPNLLISALLVCGIPPLTETHFWFLVCVDSPLRTLFIQQSKPEETSYHFLF